MSQPQALDHQALLEYLDWVNALTRSLVGDAALADDRRQETWLIAEVAERRSRVLEQIVGKLGA